jgi:hypothetical protein
MRFVWAHVGGVGAVALAVVAAMAAVPSAVVAATSPATTCVAPNRVGLVIILDDSGSMAGTDPARLRGDAAAVAIDQAADGSVLAISRFGTNATQIAAPTTVEAGSRADLKQRTRSSLASSGGTDYELAFREAQRQLAAMPANVDRRAVVFLSDGLPNTTAYTADRAIGASGTKIHTIGFGMASATELTAIATRSGGRSWHAGEAFELPMLFAHISALVRCDVRIAGTDSVTLAPGTSMSLPFDVLECQQEVRALVTWSTGSVHVEVVRPDGTVMGPANLRAWEQLVTASGYVSATSTDAEPGRWRIDVTAAPENLAAVTASLNVWGDQCAGVVALPDPVLIPPVGPTPVADSCHAAPGTGSTDTSITLGWAAANPTLL